jgi:hypothetical protein
MAYALAGAFSTPSDLRDLSAAKLKYNQGVPDSCYHPVIWTQKR